MKNKLLLFLRKNGFLLFLFICVCVVAVGTIIIATNELATTDKNNLEELVILDDRPTNDLVNPVDKDKEVLSDTTLDEAKSDEAEKSEETEEKETEETKVKEEAEPELESEEDEEEEVETEETIKDNLDDLEFVDEDEEGDEPDFVADKPNLNTLPVEGELLTEHSFDSLIYSKTLDEWRGHLGIDIKAAEGTKVVAPLDGTVKEVYKDDLWGLIVVIDHGQGLETKYANLGTMDMVKAGIKVSKGDHIGTVGKSANIEMMMEPHLHYEAIKNGKIIDPRSINK